VNDLFNLDLRRVESTGVYMTACDLAIRLNHHLFDTLYHATALHTTGATLFTADRAISPRPNRSARSRCWVT